MDLKPEEIEKRCGRDIKQTFLMLKSKNKKMRNIAAITPTIIGLITPAPLSINAVLFVPHGI